MRALRIRLAIGSVAGIGLASLLGIGLANFAESGAFTFYKQAHLAASESVDSGVSQADTAAPMGYSAAVPYSVYAGNYPVYPPAPPSQIDASYASYASYTVKDSDEPDPQPVAENAQPDRIDADTRDAASAPLPAAARTDGAASATQAEGAAPAADDARDATKAPAPAGNGE